jgi:hypothetical protein
MESVKLYDDRDPIDVGGEVFNLLMDGEEDKTILTDRDALTHAFYCACEQMGAQWQALADCAAEALRDGTNSASGRRAIEARESVAHVVDVAYTLMGTIWDATPSIREAEDSAHAAGVMSPALTLIRGDAQRTHEEPPDSPSPNSAA